MQNSSDITLLLNNCRQNQPQAMEQLFPIVYQELRKIAHRQLQNVWSVDTICTTALINEAYLKLIRQQDCKAENRAHFFAIAATAMRQILINYAESKQAQKRGGEWQRVDYTDIKPQTDQSVDTLLAINDALDEIKTIDQELSDLVELKFFAGMTELEIANVYGVTERTVRRNWKKAKALLMQALETGQDQ